MKLKLSFSTCPNDTFMFDAIANKRIDLKGFEFEIFMTDIEELNMMALNGESDITKISINAFAGLTNTYQLLTSGSAIGHGVGPLVISKRKIYPDEVSSCKIGIPGINTTANLLFSIAFPYTKNKKTYLFSEIEDAILSNEIDAGVIIHENRFTYEKKGLKKILDLGEFWEKETKLPIPLGGIAIKKSLPNQLKKDINSIIRTSIEYAFKHPNDSYQFVKKNAQELDDDIIKKHIDLYVNSFSVDLGEDGKNAIQELYKKSYMLGIVKNEITNFFIE